MKTQQILRAQGAYYVASGLWPLLSMRTFERVTGPKTDKWLVRMVGLLAATIGTSLVVSAKEDEEPDAAVVLLSMLSALAFASIEVVYVCRRQISPLYLGDALVELGIAGSFFTG